MDGSMTQAPTGGDWSHRHRPRPDGVMLRLSRWRPAGTPPPAGAPTVLILTGRAEYVEKYTETANDLTARGLHVLAMDWRGQGGSSRLLADRLIGHATDFTDFLDDLDDVLGDVTQQVQGPLIALAHSMGGHLLFRYIAERPHPFQAVIASAPMLGIRTFPLPEPSARLLAWLAVTAGRAEHYALAQGPWVASPPPAFQNNPLTSDPVRFTLAHQRCVDQPALALGGASWGWLHAALTSIRHYVEQDRLEDVQVPILLLSGRADPIVRVDRHDLAAQRLPHCTIEYFPTGRHELLMESDAVRLPVLAAIDRFLAGLHLLPCV